MIKMYDYNLLRAPSALIKCESRKKVLFKCNEFMSSLRLSLHNILCATVWFCGVLTFLVFQEIQSESLC